MKSFSQGLTWFSGWVSPGEGPYTRIAKLSLANPLPLASLQKIVTNASLNRNGTEGLKHPRTLLDNLWFNRFGAADLCGWSRELSGSVLSSITEGWTERLASDDRLRYCPTCMSHGFQSSLCQIDGITHCPAHGDALRSSCTRCGAPTPRYAWNSSLAGLNAVMCCSQCGRPFSAAWSAPNHLAWRPMPGSEHYVQLAEKIAQFRNVAWMDETGWLERFRWSSTAEQRILEFQLLQRIVASSSQFPVHAPSNSIWEALCLPFRATEVFFQDIGASAFCKAYEKTCFRLGGNLGARPNRLGWVREHVHWPGPSNPFFFQSYARKKAIATCLFRSRFESSPDFFDFERPIVPRVFRPHAVAFAAQFTLDVDGWCRFFNTCFQAELRFAKLVAERTAGLRPQDKRWGAILEAHAWGCVPKALNLPPGVGLLRVREKGDVFAVLACVALPAASQYPQAA